MQQGDVCSKSDCGCLLCLLVARNSDSKSTWSPGSVTNTSLAHELWKVPLPPKSITAPSRPPPGLTGQKPPLSTWDNSLRLGGGWGNSDARYTPGKAVPVCLEGFVICYQVSRAFGWTVCPCRLPAAPLALPKAAPSIPPCTAVGFLLRRAGRRTGGVCNMGSTSACCVLSGAASPSAFQVGHQCSYVFKHCSQRGSCCNELDHDSPGSRQTGFKTLLSLQQESEQISLYFCFSSDYVTTV